MIRLLRLAFVLIAILTLLSCCVYFADVDVIACAVQRAKHSAVEYPVGVEFQYCFEGVTP